MTYIIFGAITAVILSFIGLKFDPLDFRERPSYCEPYSKFIQSTLDMFYVFIGCAFGIIWPVSLPFAAVFLIAYTVRSVQEAGSVQEWYSSLWNDKDENLSEKS